MHQHYHSNKNQHSHLLAQFEWKWRGWKRYMYVIIILKNVWYPRSGWIIVNDNKEIHGVNQHWKLLFFYQLYPLEFYKIL